MSAQRIRVIRSTPRRRDILTGLKGDLEAVVEALTPIHISSPTAALMTDERRLREILERYGGIDERSIREVSFEEEYTPFTSTGGRPVIPGSSIKGNIRARLELSFKPKGGTVRSCLLKASRLRIPPRRGRHGWRHYGIWGDALRGDREGACDPSSGEVCLICDLFGVAGLRSLIDFTDFSGEGINLKPMRVEYGVRILAAQAGSKFRGRISFKSLKAEELGLLLIGMGIRERRRGSPRLIGRFKYRGGIGRIRYIVEALRLSRYSQPLTLETGTIKPGEGVEGESLNPIVGELTSKALKKYGGELMIVEEAEIVEKLR